MKDNLSTFQISAGDSLQSRKHLSIIGLYARTHVHTRMHGTALRGCFAHTLWVLHYPSELEEEASAQAPGVLPSRAQFSPVTCILAGDFYILPKPRSPPGIIRKRTVASISQMRKLRHRALS